MRELPNDFEQLLRRHCPGLGEGDPLDPRASLWELGMGSLEALGVIMDVEVEYQVVISENLLNGDIFDTPEALWLALRSLLRGETA